MNDIGMYVIQNCITVNHQHQVVFCILANNMKRINNNNQFRNELKDLHIKGRYYSTDYHN
jgi:hypothetical protein